MFSYNSKLQDQIFNLKFAAKQFTKESQKAEKEEKAEKLKIKKAMEKGNIEGAKIYAQNAIRKKNEAQNYLQLSSQLDAVVSQLSQQAKMQAVGKNMANIVGTLDSALKNKNLTQVAEIMNKFETQQEQLTVQANTMTNTFNQQVALAADPEEVKDYVNQYMEGAGLEARLGMPQAGTSQPVVAQQAEEKEDELQAALAALKAR